MFWGHYAVSSLLLTRGVITFSLGKIQICGFYFICFQNGHATSQIIYSSILTTLSNFISCHWLVCLLSNLFQVNFINVQNSSYSVYMHFVELHHISTNSRHMTNKLVYRFHLQILFWFFLYYIIYILQNTNLYRNIIHHSLGMCVHNKLS